MRRKSRLWGYAYFLRFNFIFYLDCWIWNLYDVVTVVSEWVIVHRVAHWDEESGVTDKMDDYMFKTYVGRCRNVAEATTYLEIFTYSVSIRSDVWKMVLIVNRIRRLILLKNIHWRMMSLKIIYINGQALFSCIEIAYTNLCIGSIYTSEITRWSYQNVGDTINVSSWTRLRNLRCNSADRHMKITTKREESGYV
jgi:hypothetical protein